LEAILVDHFLIETYMLKQSFAISAHCYQEKFFNE